ncbi:MAG: helix-turn-helix transcriptional regulator [Chitinophagaceae bacterium]
MAISMHHGNRFRWWVEKRFKKRDDFIKKGVVNSYEMLTYYFEKEYIKPQKIAEFCVALNINTEQFYKSVNETDSSVKESPLPYQVSKHQGRNLQTTLKDKGMSRAAFAQKMKISRPTLYKWFKQKEIDTGILLEAAQVLKIPQAQLKGFGEGQPSFERDIYLQLKQLNEKISHMESVLLQFTKQH